MQQPARNRQRYHRSFRGLVADMYYNIVGSGKDYSVSRQELIHLACNSVVYWKLYEEWVNSGYQHRNTPSVDRIDNTRGYHIDNIQFLTQAQNAVKGNGKPVAVWDGKEWLQFDTTRAAGRYLDVHPDVASVAVCRGYTIRGHLIRRIHASERLEGPNQG